jgi:hypothetical protein
MRTQGISMKPVLHSFAYGLDYLREQVAGVADADFVAQPKGILNHPAWTIGHLTDICQMVGEVIGVEPWLPADWAKRYGSGSVPLADASVYEAKSQALRMLVDAQSRISLAVQRLTDDQLDEPFPGASYQEVFPSIRHFLTQVLVAHTAFHVGQISIWRKAMGLPPMVRSFE